MNTLRLLALRSNVSVARPLRSAVRSHPAGTSQAAFYRSSSILVAWLTIFFGLAAAAGCRPRTADEVVVYAALDREFSEPVLRDFERETGIRVVAKFDLESTKTVGLVNELRRERNHPRCDVFWNNEIMHTLALEREGLLAVHDAVAGERFPADVRSPDGKWYGFAARARVLVINTELVPETDRPTSVDDLAHPRWEGKCGLAKPLFGTTATHAAVIFSRRGPEAAREFFGAVRKNAKIMSGNKQVAIAVGRGQLAWGLTDTDDAFIEIEQGRPVAIVFPDQGDDQTGTLFIPNSACILDNAPHAAAARRLLDFLLQASVERRLALGASGQFPLASDVTERPQRAGESPIRRMEVDFRAAADEWPAAAEWLRTEFE